ncbi:LacI family DNA-binding transcriptional regulator [Actinoplanes sp. NPDC026670]|uniref:LacI family DNA-binding transcriptional regulator n=1 Tax=Actinoplanes sp. NPDC026670 TaxID=3154700 RepID=UPI0033E2C882
MSAEDVNGRRRATVKDVAVAAGVSPATVSRVLAGDYPVATGTKARVQRAIRELDYVANAQARVLKGGSSGMIAFVLDDVTGPSFAYVAKGVEQQATEEGRLCIICTTHGDPERELAVVDAMREQHAEAVILVGGGLVGEEYRQRMIRLARALDKAGSRLVLCGRPPLGEDVPATVVEYDNEGGAFAITSFLLSQGHRRIVYLGKVADNHTTSRERIAGYLRAHELFGVEHDPALIVPGDFTQAYGERATRQLLAAGTAFTAIFAATDMVAAGVLRTLRAAGRRVPEDVSVVGYDDIPLAIHVVPALTTVRIPTEELGRAAVRLALRPAESQHVVLGTHIVVRESVRPVAPPNRG